MCIITGFFIIDLFRPLNIFESDQTNSPLKIRKFSLNY